MAAADRKEEISPLSGTHLDETLASQVNPPALCY